jgi:intracellular multiplication protein IcmG
MADNDQNDEYKFAELDSLDNDSGEHMDFGSGEHTPSGQEPKPPKKDIKRNALIAVALVIFAMVMYKLIGGIFSGKSNTATKSNLPPAPIAAEITPQQPQPIQAEIAPQPIQPAQPIQPVQPVVQENTSALSQKVDSIETNQQNVQSQVSSMNEQVGNVNNNVNNLTAQITKLNQTIADLTTQLNRQSEEITILMQRTKPKPIRRPVRPYRYGQANIYYINAVIPGRAWLIGTNGSTLTVREGTKIAGYGVVKLIDSMEGRILTSSGRVIRFSQDDS